MNTGRNGLPGIAWVVEPSRLVGEAHLIDIIRKRVSEGFVVAVEDLNVDEHTRRPRGMAHHNVIVVAASNAVAAIRSLRGSGWQEVNAPSSDVKGAL